MTKYTIKIYVRKDNTYRGHVFDERGINAPQILENGMEKGDLLHKHWFKMIELMGEEGASKLEMEVNI